MTRRPPLSSTTAELVTHQKLKQPKQQRECSNTQQVCIVVARSSRQRRTGRLLLTAPPHCFLLFLMLFQSNIWRRTTTACHAFTPLWSSLSSRPRQGHSFLSVSTVAWSELTVKELRQRVKESPNVPRGVLSKLKKKQDLIDYLSSHQQQQQQQQRRSSSSSSSSSSSMTPPGPDQSNGQNNMDESSNNSNNNDRKPPSPASNRTPVDRFNPKTRIPLKMPPLSESIVDKVAPPKREGSSTDPSAPPPSWSLRDATYEEVYTRYPPLRDMPREELVSPIDDVRQVHHPLLAKGNSSSDMDLVFVGTASCIPGTTRGVSCTALRLNWNRRSAIWNAEKQRTENVDAFQGGTWLFDVGECTQLQIQRSKAVRPSKITKIFLTHAHGDHSFGLPGLLCLMGRDRDRDSPPVDIYGPQGLRMWLRVAIRYSVSRIVPPYRVHEIMDVPLAPEWKGTNSGRLFHDFQRGHRDRWGDRGLSGEDPSSWISLANYMPLQPSTQFGEIEGGRDIYPIYGHPMSSDGAPVWEIENEDDVRVYAAPMSHGIPCVGYTVEEQPRPGRLRNELVDPIVQRNFDALKEAGFRFPMKAKAVIKGLDPGTSFTFPDGTVLTQEQAVEPFRKGRKIVICGDTCDSRAMLNLAQDADVLVHEATNCYLPGLDKDTDVRAVTKDTMIHGHSTPQIAGKFAQQVNAKRLILNHFSARYKGDLSMESLSIMYRIEKIAEKASGLDESSLCAAWDLMSLPVEAH